MNWIFGKGLVYPGGRVGAGLTKPEELPAIISDDGVTILWTKNVPVPGILAIIYHVNDIEAEFQMESQFDDGDIFTVSMAVSSPTLYRKLIFNDNVPIKKVSYSLSPEGIEEVKRHLRNALPLWNESPSSPFQKVFRLKQGTVINVLL